MNAKSAVGLTPVPSDWALRELPSRAATFLWVVGSHAPIRAAMQSAGYGSRDHEEGLTLLLAACPYGTGGLDPSEDQPAREASASVERWARTHVGRLRAAVERLHPDALWVFASVDPMFAGSSLLGVAQLLENFQLMDGDDEYTDVLETLARRGFGGTERARLESLVQTAKRAREPSNPETPNSSNVASSPRGESDGSPDEAVLLLYQWLNDWSTTARAVLRRKDWLIRLGVSRRRKRE